MNIAIYPSTISGEVTVPSSKSITHRSLIAASLANGTSLLKNILLSDDTRYTIEALRSFGVKIEQNDNAVKIQGTGGILSAPSKPLFLGNSGTSLRLFTALAAIAKGKTELTGEKRLCERPIGPLLSALKTLGTNTQTKNNNDCPPVVIKGGSVNGGTITLDASVSSQYLSALLFIAPLATAPITIHIKELKSKPYVDLTIEVMKQFGIEIESQNYKTFSISPQQYKAIDMNIEGDYSSASYFFAAAAITKGAVIVQNLNPDSKQGDAYFLDLLKQMGCRVEKTAKAITIKGTSDLQSIEADLGDYPDIVQTLAITAAFAKGKTIIKNIAHLKYKETDRLTATATELQKMGVAVVKTEDGLIIEGGKPNGATIETYKDHRMAMSFAIAGLKAEGKTVILHTEVTRKSYENFFTDLQKVGVRIEEINTSDGGRLNEVMP